MDWKDSKVKLLMIACAALFVLTAVLGLWNLNLSSEKAASLKALDQGKQEQELQSKASAEKFVSLEDEIRALQEKISTLEKQVEEKDGVIAERNGVITTMVQNMEQVSAAYDDLINRINQAPPEQTLESLKHAIEEAASSGE